ncbi:MAG: CRTAC1 family protein [Chloroflexi bacterium]|nr:CRTAC1 family protein [Chloroflexota bacterium]
MSATLLPKRTWPGAVTGVFILFALFIVVGCTSSTDSVADTTRFSGTPPTSGAATSSTTDQFAPFTNIGPDLGGPAEIFNRYPGVVIFDFDRDGDLDFYVTQAEINAPLEVARGGPNRLFRNDGNGRYTEVAGAAGVAAADHNSTAVAACDFNNDGYQDLYVGAQGRIGDNLDFGSVDDVPGLRRVIQDRLYLNNGDSTFTDITDSAFGTRANIRSTGSIACGDVDGDGWLDIYVGNRADVDFVRFDTPAHSGNFNLMYRNNGDLTFTDITIESGLLGPEIVMRDSDGFPITFPIQGGEFEIEGFDPSIVDDNGNPVGDPTSQTWATLFFDHDNDGDLDLWVANDGDRIQVYRNDTVEGRIEFRNIAHEMGVDQSGAWMGFALGDFDGDADLDIFVTNIGFNSLVRGRPSSPGGDCTYAHQFDWGTCFHYLLRNDGVREIEGVGTVGVFPDVAGSTQIEPSAALPPESLTPSNIESFWQVPTGLAAYDFGFGTVFFDIENDGDQDLYWLGAIIARGEGPGGMLFPGFGRMLQNIGGGKFRDITVESHLIDSQGVDYSKTDPSEPGFDRLAQRMGPEFHENGKGLAKGDLNGDGFVDLIGTNSSGEIFDEPGVPGGTSVVAGPLMVWINGGGDNSWLTLRLKGRMAVDGTGSNADGIGAFVTVTSEGADGRPLVQVQTVLGSSTFLSMNSLDLTFGIGSAERVDRVEIKWPSGVSQTLTDVTVNQVLEVIEPAG